MSALYRRSTRGQDLVELAITLPILLLMLMAIIDLGRVSFFYATLNNAVREGARAGTIAVNDCLVGNPPPKTKAQVIAYVQDMVVNRSIALNLTSADVTVSYGFNCPTYPPPTPDQAIVTVSATYHFTPMTPFVVSILRGKNTLPLTVTSSMHIENY